MIQSCAAIYFPALLRKLQDVSFTPPLWFNSSQISLLALLGFMLLLGASIKNSGYNLNTVGYSVLNLVSFQKTVEAVRCIDSFLKELYMIDEDL